MLTVLADQNTYLIGANIKSLFVLYPSAIFFFDNIVHNN